MQNKSTLQIAHLLWVVFLLLTTFLIPLSLWGGAVNVVFIVVSLSFTACASASCLNIRTSGLNFTGITNNVGKVREILLLLGSLFVLVPDLAVYTLTTIINANSNPQTPGLTGSGTVITTGVYPVVNQESGMFSDVPAALSAVIVIISLVTLFIKSIKTKHISKGEYSYLKALSCRCIFMCFFISMFIKELGFMYTQMPDLVYVPVSVILRLVMALGIWSGYKVFFVRKKITPEYYESWKQFTGYAIVLTYFICILPQIVRDFYKESPEPEGLVYVIGAVLCTAFPTLIWIILSFNKTRISTCAYSEKQLAERIKIHKDKKLLKKKSYEQKKSRSHAGNLWVSWGEPIAGALLWVLVIHHFFLQLYQIPSESMVPTFFVYDRVAVTKTLNGPTIPLTQFNIPPADTPETGEIVTFLNPAVDEKFSSVSYGSVFSRIFQPLIYFITLTFVDIDTDFQGNPKARLLVKRVIGEPGERILLLNDVVYKQTETGWQSMEEISGTEYGYSNLSALEYPLLKTQTMTPVLRSMLDEAARIVEEVDIDRVSEQLAEAKNRMISAYNRLQDTQLSAQLLQYLTGALPQISETALSLQNEAEKDLRTRGQNETRLSRRMRSYGSLVLYALIKELQENFSQEKNDPGYLNSQIMTGVPESTDLNPYTEFMRKLNALYKLRMVQFGTLVLDLAEQSNGYREFEQALHTLEVSASDPSTEEEIPGFYDLRHIFFYLSGLDFSRLSYELPRSRLNYFSSMNFAPYPADPNDAIPEDEYFVMGDNRYNSIDSRFKMGGTLRRIPVDSSDQGYFTAKTQVRWRGYTIPLRYIEGRTLIRFFPFNRVKFF